MFTSKDPFVAVRGQRQQRLGVRGLQRFSTISFSGFNRGSPPFSSSQARPAGAAMYGEDRVLVRRLD